MPSGFHEADSVLQNPGEIANIGEKLYDRTEHDCVERVLAEAIHLSGLALNNFNSIRNFGDSSQLVPEAPQDSRRLIHSNISVAVWSDPHNQHSRSAADFTDSLWLEPEDIAHSVLDPLTHIVERNWASRVAAVPALGIEPNRPGYCCFIELTQVESFSPLADKSGTRRGATQNFVHVGIVGDDIGYKSAAIIINESSLTHRGMHVQNVLDFGGPSWGLRLILWHRDSPIMIQGIDHPDCLMCDRHHPGLKHRLRRYCLIDPCQNQFAQNQFRNFLREKRRSPPHLSTASAH